MGSVNSVITTCSFSFMGNGDDSKDTLINIYMEGMSADSSFYEKLKDELDNDKIIQEMFAKENIQWRDEDEMLTGDGFFNSLTDEQAAMILNVLAP